jgi:hypothetical protein
MQKAKHWSQLLVVCFCVVSATAKPWGEFAARRSPPRPLVTTPTAAITEGTYGNIGVWPLPAGAAAIGDVPLNPLNFSILVCPEADPYLVEVARRYKDIILYHPAPAAPPPSSFHTLRLTVSDPSVRELQQDVDESYTLAFDDTLSTATVSSITIFGARHGLETFSQLVTADRLSGVYRVAAMNISEAPRFAFRGLLIDAARHWLPPNLLLSLMDGMSFNKLNAVSDQSAVAGEGFALKLRSMTLTVSGPCTRSSHCGDLPPCLACSFKLASALTGRGRWSLLPSPT